MSSHPPCRPIEILLVQDDREQSAKTLAELERARLLNAVQVVPNAREAVRCLRREGAHRDAPHPELILYDGDLPAAEAQVLAYELEHDTTPQRPHVVVLRGGADADLPEGMRSAAHLDKPLELNQFLRTMRQLSDLCLAVVRQPAGSRPQPQPPAATKPAGNAGLMRHLAEDDAADAEIEQRMQRRPLSDSPGAKLTQYNVGDHVCVQIEENWLTEALEIETVAAALNRLVDDMPTPWLVIDFGKVNHVGSIMLGKLVALQRRLEELGGQLRLVNLNDDMRQIFSVTHMDGKIEICDSLEEATGV